MDQEGPEFFGVGPIEHVWIPDFRPRGQQLVVAMGRAGKVTDSDSKVVEDSHVWIELTIGVDPVLIIIIVIIIPGIISRVISRTISRIVVAIRVRVSIVATWDRVAQVSRDTASRVRGWRWGITGSETPELADGSQGLSPVGESLLSCSLSKVINSVSFFGKGI